MKKVNVHKEGYFLVFSSGLILMVLNLLICFAFEATDTTVAIVSGLSIVLFLFIVYFFRSPLIVINGADDKQILAPADGRIVVIEEVEETEYFKDRRLQVSIFMSPTNVHVNRTPVAGTVKYTKYHRGNYMVAWHPKSSLLNERFTSVIECEGSEVEILVRQIAGKLARKISNYLDEGEEVTKGEELGFIKFGSRVDLFLPLEANIKVNLKEKVKGGKTVLAELP